MTWAHAIVGGYLFAGMAVAVGSLLMMLICWLSDEHPRVLGALALIVGFSFAALLIAKLLHG